VALLVVVEVAAADAIKHGCSGDEKRGRGALLRGLPQLCARDKFPADVPLELGGNRARVDGVDGNAIAGSPSGGFDGEQVDGGLGLRVGLLGVVGPEAEIQVVEDDWAGRVGARAQRDPARAVGTGQGVVEGVA
jgi:hypothetical protein